MGFSLETVFSFPSSRHYDIAEIQELEFFFCCAKREFFFQNLTLGYMTKALNHIIFFFLHQNQNIFFSNIGNQNIFLEKKHNPFKLNGRSLSRLNIKNRFFCICFLANSNSLKFIWVDLILRERPFNLKEGVLWFFSKKIF